MIPCIACSPRRVPGALVTVSLPGTRQTQERVNLCRLHSGLLHHYWNAMPFSQRSSTQLWRFIELEVYRNNLEKVIADE
jgi:hypothetical protein